MKRTIGVVVAGLLVMLGIGVFGANVAGAQDNPYNGFVPAVHPTWKPSPCPTYKAATGYGSPCPSNSASPSPSKSSSKSPSASASSSSPAASSSSSSKEPTQLPVTSSISGKLLRIVIGTGVVLLVVGFALLFLFRRHRLVTTT